MCRWQVGSPIESLVVDATGDTGAQGWSQPLFVALAAAAALLAPCTHACFAQGLPSGSTNFQCLPPTFNAMLRPPLAACGAVYLACHGRPRPGMRLFVSSGAALLAGGDIRSHASSLCLAKRELLAQSPPVPPPAAPGPPRCMPTSTLVAFVMPSMHGCTADMLVKGVVVLAFVDFAPFASAPLPSRWCCGQLRRQAGGTAIWHQIRCSVPVVARIC